MLRVTLEQIPPSAPHKKVVIATMDVVGAPEKDDMTLASTDFYASASGDAADGRRTGSFRSPERCRWGAFRICVEAIKALRLDLLER